MNLHLLTRSSTLLILSFGREKDEEGEKEGPSPFSSAISLIIHAWFTHPLDPARRQKDFLILMYY